MWVPYDCHLHYYSTPDIYRCAAASGVSWIHAMGDSQEREFVAHMKMVRNDGEKASKFEQVWRGGALHAHVPHTHHAPPPIIVALLHPVRLCSCKQSGV